MPDNTWAYLVRKHYISEFEGGLIGVDDVVSEILELKAAGQDTVTSPPGDADGKQILGDINNRMQALAEAVAARASRDETVLRWRQRWLPDGLIDVAALTRWIDDVYRRYRPDTWPADRSPRDASNIAAEFAPWPHEYVKLQWFDTDQRSVKVWCVPPRGPLADLAGLADRLVEDWDWHPALATNFVVTGETPARPGVRGISYRERRGFDDHYGEYDFMFVRASIDVEVTPEELAAWWRGVRAELGMAGRKPIGAKSARLALFAMSRDDNTTYRQDMDAWNAQVSPDWRFEDWRNFRTAGHKALRALNRPAAGCRFAGRTPSSSDAGS